MQKTISHSTVRYVTVRWKARRKGEAAGTAEKQDRPAQSQSITAKEEGRTIAETQPEGTEILELER